MAMREDHPRSRGEYAQQMKSMVFDDGSSPLSRGIRQSFEESLGAAGIIPALAGNTRDGKRNDARSEDHPRSRGEYPAPRCDPNVPSGSSPLSRGILFAGRVQRVQQRIIPALAGNTRKGRSKPTRTLDHPRSRGEYAGAVIHSPRHRGSSPLSRGIHTQENGEKATGRIIPALAGNTPCTTTNTASFTDHPRSRGEYETKRTGLWLRGGSSPLSRGILQQRREVVVFHGSSPLSRGILEWEGLPESIDGIIPALAGNTSTSRPKPVPATDHPRSRGEYPCRPEESFNASGSSPLSRGIPRYRQNLRRQEGIIPALAGNTPAASEQPSSCEDHPRSRGEYTLPEALIPSLKGSSPLSRGILDHYRIASLALGIIPALAGNTPSSASCLLWASDHPRSRGEYKALRPLVVISRGSSPLSRGIPDRAGVRRSLSRIIPALAGNTLRHWG